MYSLTIAARVGLSYGKTTVNITILDENDNQPLFSRDKYEVHLPENAAVGQEVYLARARDRDAGINSQVSYGLSFNCLLYTSRNVCASEKVVENDEEACGRASESEDAGCCRHVEYLASLGPSICGHKIPRRA